MAAEKEENGLDLFSLFAFLKETPKVFWGKPKAPGPVSVSLETGLLMSAESGFVLLLQRPVSTVLKSLPCSSAVLTSGPLGFNQWLCP